MMKTISKLCGYAYIICILTTSRIRPLREFRLEIPSFWALIWLKGNKEHTRMNLALTGTKFYTYWGTNLKILNLQISKRSSKAPTGFGCYQDEAVSITKYSEF